MIQFKACIPYLLSSGLMLILFFGYAYGGMFGTEKFEIQ